MENIKYVQVKDPDSGALSEAYLLEVEAQNVIFEDKENLVEKMAKKSDKVIYGDNEVNLGRIEDSEKGLNSITLGTENIASGDYATATGYNTIAAGDHSHVEGRYNIEDTENRYAFIIGNGYLPEVTEEIPSPDPIRSNAFAVDWEGKVYAKTFINGDGAELYPSLKSIFVNDVEYNLNGGSLILQAGDNITLTPGVTEGTDNEDIVDGSLTVIISSTGGGSGSGGGDGEYLPLAGGKVYGPVIIERDTERVSELEDENGNFKHAFRVRDKNNPGSYLDLSYKAITTNKTLQLNKILNGYVEIGNTITFSSTGTGGTHWTKNNDAPLQALQWGNVDTQAFGYYSQAFGTSAKSYGLNSFAQGDSVEALGESSHAEGVSSKAKGAASHAEGIATIATGEYSHAEGAYSQAYGEGSHAEGFNSQLYIKTEGLEDDEVKNDILNQWNQSNVDSWDDANLYQKFGLAFGKASHIQGRENLALGNYSSANGVQTVADGEAATANGKGSTATGRCATVDGYQCVANGNEAYANGYQCSSTGRNSEARGYRSNIKGIFSYINGYNSFLQGDYSYLYGSDSKVKGNKCFIYGNNNDLNLAEGSFVCGNNIKNNTYAILKENNGLQSVPQKGIFIGDNLKVSYKDTDGLLPSDAYSLITSIILGKDSYIDILWDHTNNTLSGQEMNGQRTPPCSNILIGEDNFIKEHSNAASLNDNNYYSYNDFGVAEGNVIIGSKNQINTAVKTKGYYILGFNNNISKEEFWFSPHRDNGVIVDGYLIPDSQNSGRGTLFKDSTMLNDCYIFGVKNNIKGCSETFITGYLNNIIGTTGGDFIYGSQNNILLRFSERNYYSSFAGGGNFFSGNRMTLKGIGFYNCHFEGSEHSFIDERKDEDYSTCYLSHMHVEGFQNKNARTTESYYYSWPSFKPGTYHIEGAFNTLIGAHPTEQMHFHVEGDNNTYGGFSSSYNGTSNGSLHIEGELNSVYWINSDDPSSPYWRDQTVSGVHVEGYMNFLSWQNGMLDMVGWHIEGNKNNLLTPSDGWWSWYLGAGMHIEGNENTFWGQGDGVHIEGSYNNVYHACYEGSHIEGFSNVIGVLDLEKTDSYGYILYHMEGQNHNFKSSSGGGTTLHIEGNGHYDSKNVSYSGSTLHIEGYQNNLLDNLQNGSTSHIEGYFNQTNNSGHVEGRSNLGLGRFAHAEGGNVITLGAFSHAEGIGNISPNTYWPDDFNKPVFSEIDYSYEAWNTNKHCLISAGRASHAEGCCTYAGGDFSHTEGLNTYTGAIGAHAEGQNTRSEGVFTHTEGDATIARGVSSHSEGQSTLSIGTASHAEGGNTIAYGVNSHAEGFSQNQYTTVFTDFSYEEWLNNKALIAYGNYSHAEGNSTYAEGLFSHTEGFQTYAKEVGTHAEGNTTQALGQFAHAQNIQTIAEGAASHAGGYLSKALGLYSFTHGDNIVAASHHQFVIGKYNIEDVDGEYAFILGNGGPQVDEETGETIDEIIYSNAFTIDWDGKVSASLFNGAINTHKIGNADFNGTQDITLEDIGVPSKEELDETYSKKEDTVKSIEIKDYEINYTNGIGETKSYQLPVTEMPIGTIITNDNPNSSGFEYGNWKCLGKNTMILSPLDETSNEITEVITYVWKRIEDEITQSEENESENIEGSN